MDKFHLNRRRMLERYPWIPKWSNMLIEPLLNILKDNGLTESPTSRSLVLDLCCGEGITGRTFLNVASGFWNMIGLDLNKDMIKYAESYKRDNICYINGDADKLPLRNDCANLILFTQAMHRLGNPISILIESQRVLKKNGIVALANIIGDGEQGSLREFFVIAREYAQQNGCDNFLRKPSVLSFNKLEWLARKTKMQKWSVTKINIKKIIESEYIAINEFPFEWYLWDIPNKYKPEELWKVIRRRLIGKSITVEIGCLIGSW